MNILNKKISFLNNIKFRKLTRYNILSYSIKNFNNKNFIYINVLMPFHINNKSYRCIQLKEKSSLNSREIEVVYLNKYSNVYIYLMLNAPCFYIYSRN